MSLLVRCPAKINPRLRVLHRRDDGFHELDLDFQSLAVHDDLGLERAEGFTLRVEGAPPGEVPTDDNLVLRAARRLRDEVGPDRIAGAALVLRKRIPAAAGLGGGSSDAAGALEGLLRLWDVEVDPELLAAVALSVGSDVPYFLAGGRQRGRGRGERLEALPEGPDAPVVLVRARTPLSTAAVFGRLAARRSRERDSDRSLTTRNGATTLKTGSMGNSGDGPCENDLWPAAVEALPMLAESIREVRAAWPDATVGLSGSGPTLFALGGAGSDEAAREAAALLERRLASSSDVLLTRTLGRAEYRARRFDR